MSRIKFLITNILLLVQIYLGLQMKNISSLITKTKNSKIIEDETFEDIQNKLNSQLKRQISKEKILKLNL